MGAVVLTWLHGALVCLGQAVSNSQPPHGLRCAAPTEHVASGMTAPGPCCKWQDTAPRGWASCSVWG